MDGSDAAFIEYIAQYWLSGEGGDEDYGTVSMFGDGDTFSRSGTMRAQNYYHPNQKNKSHTNNKMQSSSQLDSSKQDRVLRQL